MPAMMNIFENPLPAFRTSMLAFHTPLPDYDALLPDFLDHDNFIHHPSLYYPQFNGGYHVHIHNFSPHPIITPELMPSEEGFSFHPDSPQSLINPNPSNPPASPPILEGTYFPAIFFDGKNQIDIGDIVIHPYLDYIEFIMVISHTIGIPASEISTFLIRRRPPLGLPSKILIDNDSDFAAISLELHCHFLATRKTMQLTRTQIREFRSMLDAAESEIWEASEVNHPVKSGLNVKARRYEYPREIKVEEVTRPVKSVLRAEARIYEYPQEMKVAEDAKTAALPNIIFSKNSPAPAAEEKAAVLPIKVIFSKNASEAAAKVQPTKIMFPENAPALAEAKAAVLPAKNLFLENAPETATKAKATALPAKILFPENAPAAESEVKAAVLPANTLFQKNALETAVEEKATTMPSKKMFLENAQAAEASQEVCEICLTAKKDCKDPFIHACSMMWFLNSTRRKGQQSGHATSQKKL